MINVYVIYSIEYPYLPIAVFDTQLECADFLGLTSRAVKKYINNQEHIYCSRYLIAKVILENDLTNEEC